MLETDIDFTATTDDEIVEFIVRDLSRFHEKQFDARRAGAYDDDVERGPGGILRAGPTVSSLSRTDWSPCLA